VSWMGRAGVWLERTGNSGSVEIDGGGSVPAGGSGGATYSGSVVGARELSVSASAGSG